MLKSLSIFFICVSSLLGQTTTVNLGLQGSNADFRSFPYVYPVPQGATLPLTCIVGQGYFLTNVYPSPASGTLYNCSATNTWTQVGGASANATSVLGIPFLGVPTNGQVWTYQSSGNRWAPVTPTGSSYTNGTGILLSSTTFSLDTTYTDAHYFNIANVNTLTQQSTPGVAPSAGFVKFYAKTGTNQVCTYNSSGVESCTSTGISTPVSIANGGTGQITAILGFNALSPLTTIGDTLYGAASGVGTRLAGNTTTTPKVLTSTGDGVNATAPAWGTYVSSVNGATGVVSVATGNYQTFLVNGGALTNRPKANYTGTGGTTVSSTDNGSDTETITINSSSTATPTASGSALPSATCNAGTLGNLYTRTGIAANTNSSGSDFYVCSNITGSTYRWVLQTPHKVNVMSYGCKADGSTDDSTCFNNAIADAKLMTQYSSKGYYGAEVYIPNGLYEILSPIIMPRTGNTSNGTNNGGVSLIGESFAGVTLVSNSSFPKGATEAFIMTPGSGYTGSPTVAFGTGCSTTPVGYVLTQKNYVAKIFLTTQGSGCTSMPTCTISGAGTGATCELVGRAMIEWDQTANQRIVQETIKNINFIIPNVIGTMGIHKQDIGDPSPPSSSGNHVEDERFEGLTLAYLGFLGSNQYTPMDIYLGGDCFGCDIHDIGGNPAQGAIAYETVVLATDQWYDGATADEGSGFNFSNLLRINGGGSRGGFDSAFQGRLSRSTFTASFCNGQTVGTGTITNNQCYAFYHSSANDITNLGNEGLNDNPQILMVDSHENRVRNTGIGSPIAGAGDGLDLISSNGNTFDGHLGGSGTTFASIGKVCVNLDSGSHNNRFMNWQANGGIVADTSISDLTTNFFQSCNSASSGCLNGTPMTILGYIPGMSLNGTNTQPTCNANTRGAMWPVRNGSGVKDQVQVCLQTGVGTTLAWTTIF